MMLGTRLPDAVLGEPGRGWDAWMPRKEGDEHPTMAAPGSYMKVTVPESAVVYWYIVDPAGTPGTIVTHTVTEHEDGTITVSPSIWDAPDGWHGWLEHGTWRSV